MDINQALRKMMKDRGLTQVVVAEKLGTKQSNIAMYLRSNNAIKVENLMKIADVCGYDVVLVDRVDGSRMYKVGEDDVVESRLILKDESEFERSGAETLDEAVRRIVRDEMQRSTESTPPRSE